MIYTQARVRVSNSPANSLPTSENSAAGHLGQIVPKPLICRRFATFRGCFWRLKRFFFPAGREMRRSEPWPDLRRSLGQASPSQQIKVGLKARGVREADLAQGADAKARHGADQPADRFRRLFATTKSGAAEGQDTISKGKVAVA